MLFALAFLLARGRLLAWSLGQRSRVNEEYLLGLVIGAIGASEAILPGARYPYVTSTLMAGLLAMIGSWRTSAAALGFIIAAFAIILDWSGAVAVGTAFVLATAVVAIFKTSRRHSITSVPEAFVAGGAGHLGAYVLALLRVIPHYPASLGSILANGFGLAIIVLVLRDARYRSEFAAQRLELEQMKVAMRDAQLGALRARVRPHFLFNALTSIAALCSLDPPGAEKAVVTLSQIMRRSLESDATSLRPVQEELAAVKAYVDIEKLRLGSRLIVGFSVDEGTLTTSIPAFGLQTLVENAIVHGVAVHRKGGAVQIVIRAARRGLLVAVQDNGLGFDRRGSWASEKEHGLGILSRQLQLLFGKGHRLRVFSTPGCGTLALFTVPQHQS